MKRLPPLLKVARLAVVLMPLAATSASVPLLQGCGGGGSDHCCKTCTNGKACGDSCIPANETCHVGAGCACNG